MKQVIVRLIPTLCLIGCVSSNQVTRADQYAEINAHGQEYRATITVYVDGVSTEYDGDYVTVGRDSAQWVDPETQQPHIAATVNLRRIQFNKRFKGAFEGLAFGILPGAGLFIVNYQEVYRGNLAMGLSVFTLSLGGVIIGAATGAIIGHKTNYIFPVP